MAKTIDIKPGNLGMDARSMPADLDFKAWRYNQNFRLTTKGKMCRMPGFDRAFLSTNNSDLHDQLLSKSGQAARAPITFVHEVTSNRKATKLLAGTSRVLFAYNAGTGNWKIISDEHGTDDTRWRGATIEDIFVVSNNYDFLGYWLFDSGITEANNQSVAPIPDLVDLEITKAGVVVAWLGHVFLMNVTVSGQVRGHSIYWPNYNKPLDWQPGTASTAGSADLDSGETILAALPMANKLLVYTNKGIWEGIAVGGEQVFQFSKRYSPQNGEACLFYPNTLVSTGNQHVYAGEDGIYAYSLFADKPVRTEWIHKASEVMFKNINRDLCEVHVAGYDTEHKELLFSYATGDNELPNETLSLHTEYPFSSVLDFGISAMTSHTHRGSTILVRDFLRDNCICDDAGIAANWGDFVKEGGLCEAEDPVVCDDPPTSIYTTVTRTETDGAESVVVEDWDEASAGVDSLCAQLDGITLAELCVTESSADECNSGKRFIVASSEDYTLKELSDNYYREMALTFTGCGTYEQRGYKSLAWSGPIWGGISESEKQWNRFELEATNVEQLVPSIFRLRIGHHSQAVDPSDDNCGILWDYQDDKDIDCLGGDTAAGHASAGTRPAETYEWPLYVLNSYLYFQLSIENPNVTPVDTGGECCISRISIDMNAVTRRRF